MIDLNSIPNCDPHSARMVVEARRAVEAVKPYGDHLIDWLISEVSAHSQADKEWVRGILKGAVADQQPEVPMWWLDERLPTNTRFERETR